ncbi:MAG: metal-dependent hydrolase [Promethearchaeota archaeon]
MMPHVHLLLGITSVNILAYWGYDPSNLIWFVVGSIFPDIDYIFNLVIRKRSHRQLPTHFLLLYLLGVFGFGIWGLSPLFWFFLGALYHILVDVIDWEIYLLAPFSNKSFSILNLDYEKISKQKAFVNFFKYYYHNRKIILLEIFTIILWIWSLNL